MQRNINGLKDSLRALGSTPPPLLAFGVYSFSVQFPQILLMSTKNALFLLIDIYFVRCDFKRWSLYVTEQTEIKQLFDISLLNKGRRKKYTSLTPSTYDMYVIIPTKMLCYGQFLFAVRNSTLSKNTVYFYIYEKKLANGGHAPKYHIFLTASLNELDFFVWKKLSAS